MSEARFCLDCPFKGEIQGPVYETHSWEGRLSWSPATVVAVDREGLSSEVISTTTECARNIESKLEACSGTVTRKRMFGRRTLRVCGAIRGSINNDSYDGIIVDEAIEDSI